MKLHELRPNEGAHTRRRRLGRRHLLHRVLGRLVRRLVATAAGERHGRDHREREQQRDRAEQPIAHQLMIPISRERASMSEICAATNSRSSSP